MRARCLPHHLLACEFYAKMAAPAHWLAPGRKSRSALQWARSPCSSPDRRRRDADKQPEAMHAQQVIEDAAKVVWLSSD